MSLRLEHVNYIYSPDNAFRKQALKDVNLTIHDGDFIGLIGHTGSGKSTLIQHLNGLLKATEGSVYYNDQNIYEKGYSMKEHRRRVGLVFQYPEYQLFEITVLKDVCYGPKNLGMTDEEAKNSARAALQAVGIGEEIYEKSPFDLSGGQKRRVAIAGILAMDPEILVLDEPTAGLDPAGKREILGLLKKLHHETNKTIVLVSHSMEDVADYVDRIIAMAGGKVIMDGKPKEVFKEAETLESVGLGVPQVTKIMQTLNKTYTDLPADAITIDEAVSQLLAYADTLSKGGEQP